MNVLNANDAKIALIPADEAHRQLLPNSVSALLPLPLGTFVIRNNTDTPITAVFAIWSFTDASTGKPHQHTIACDGYFLGTPQAVVKAKDISLIRPDGYISEGNLAHMKGAFSKISTVDRHMAIAKHGMINLSVDSAIFSDGKIWGPDTRRYYLTISRRYFAVKSVFDEVSSARQSGQDVRACLAKIKMEAEAKGDEHSRIRAQYAALLKRGPNPDAMLDQFKQHSAPPEFSHIGEAK